MSDQVPASMTQAEFARHRGVAKSTVNEYKRKGFLVFTADGRINVEQTERVLAASLDTRGGNRSKGSDEQPAATDASYMAAKTREMQAKAARQEMETRKRAGELVEREDVKVTGFTLARNAQEAVMAVADRLSPLLAAESDSAKVHEMLSDELRQACQDLAKAARERLK